MNDTIRDYIKKQIDKKTGSLEIVEQLKKQTDELSTSEGSSLLIKNLSNPTNLTNPQIIEFRKNKLLNIKKTKISNKNINKSKSQLKLIKRCLLKKKYNNKYSFENSFKIEEKEKSLKNIKNNITNNNNNNNKYYINNISASRISPHNKCNTCKKIILDPIWDKLKSSRCLNKIEKEIRVNLKNDSVRQYIDSTDEMRLLKYKIKNKLERFERLKEIRKSEISLVDKTIESIKQSQSFLENNYYSNFVHYIAFLNKKVEKEKEILYELMNDNYRIKKDYYNLGRLVAKLLDKKNEILLWIGLQIQVKEKLKKIPKEFFYILEEDDYYEAYKCKEINKDSFYIANISSMIDTLVKNVKEKKIINIKDKERIKKYKYDVIYKNIDKFLEEYTILQNICLEKLKKYNNIQNEIGILKKEYNFNKEILINDVEKLKILEENLNKIKNLNIKLQSKYKEIKSQIYQDKKMVKSRSSLSSLDINKSIINNNINIRTKHLSQEKIDNNKNVYLQNNSSNNLFSIVMNIFHIIKLNNILKFDNYEYYPIHKHNPLIYNLNYIEKVLNLLLEEKNKYYNNPKLIVKYKKIEDKIIKESKKIKFISSLKDKELEQQEKIEQIKKRMNRKFYILKKPIDYSFVNFTDRTYKNIKKNILNLEEKKNHPNYEDLMYD